MTQFNPLSLPAPNAAVMLLDASTFWAYLLLAFSVGVIVMAVGVWFFVHWPQIKGRVGPGHKNLASGLLAVALVGLFAFAQHGVTLAQTPVPLEIPTDVIFTETNNWLATFAPIAAIGIGIAIALAVLGYLGKMIVGAFRG